MEEMKMNERKINTEQTLEERYKSKILKIFENGELSDDNLNTLKEYYNALRRGEKRIFLEDKYYGIPRQKAKSFVSYHQYIRTLHDYGKFLNKPYKEATKLDIDNYLSDLEHKTTKGIKETTLSYYALIIKIFYLWLLKAKKMPEFISHIQLIKEPLKEINPKEVLTPSDIKKMCEVSNNPRDRALLQVSFEATSRVGELVNCNISDFNKKNNYALLNLDGKTGKRTVAIIDSIPALEQWLNNHPDRTNPNSPLFVSFSDNNRNNRMTVRGIQVTFQKLGKDAEIKKKVNPHWFRHSGLDYLARRQHFNERDLRIRAGWSKNSKMPNVYLHYKEEEVNNRYLNLKGVDSEEVKIDTSLDKIICPRCKKINSPDSLYCNCGQIIDMGEALRLEKLQEDADNFTNQIMQQPLHQNIDMSKGLNEAIFQMLKDSPIFIDKFKEILLSNNLIKKDKEKKKLVNKEDNVI
ncbi:MAG: tyrosine-type recombinase/integrase [Nanoarchaeota archaeon]|nr:tyrosine-type recombinase/integrase [Nanoarchaeota archaeon]MBU1623068.1 tyrosine-type recombinase/integrase [Nanoarchaeota archaeon]